MEVNKASIYNYSQNIALEDLPAELHGHIFSFLDPQSLINGTSLTCKNFQVWENESLINWIMKNLLDDYAGALDYLDSQMTIPSNKGFSENFVNLQKTIKKNRDTLITNLRDLPEKELKKLSIKGWSEEFTELKYHLFYKIFYQFLKTLTENKFEFRGHPPKYLVLMLDDILKPPSLLPELKFSTGWFPPPKPVDPIAHLKKIMDHIKTHFPPPKIDYKKMLERIDQPAVDKLIKSIDTSQIKFLELPELQEVSPNFKNRIYHFVHCIVEKVRSIAHQIFIFLKRQSEASTVYCMEKLGMNHLTAQIPQMSSSISNGVD